METLPSLRPTMRDAVRARVLESAVELGFASADDVAPPVASGKRSGRNYGAMNDAKLLKILKELRTGGAAALGCTAKGGDVEVDTMVSWRSKTHS
jgi:hypothetical protein